MSTSPKTINEVLIELDKIVDESIRENNFLGIFAFVYHRVTAQILKEIELKNFENNERMEEFDVKFANLYISAFNDNKIHQRISKSWQISFESGNQNITILQHLIMGMNAHINLDLCLAACKVMDGKPIDDLKNDFNKVSEILYNLTEEMQDRISNVSRLMFLLDWIGKNEDEKAINFLLKETRGQSWRSAKLISELSGEEKDIAIDQLDCTIQKISEVIKNPQSKILKYMLSLIKYFEEKEVNKIINGLKGNEE